MASLTIRNLTATPLVFVHYARREGRPGGDSGPVDSVQDVARNVTANVTSLFARAKGELGRGGPVERRDPDAQPLETRDVDFRVEPFTLRETDVRAPNPGGEVMTLTLVTPDRGNGARYEVDVPAPSNRSVVLRRVAGDGPDEYTAIYLPSGGGFLAVLSSANLARWMEPLRNDYPLSMLSIPGTHNSATCHRALVSVRCQAVPPREQLDNGVRFFDVRVSSSPDDPDLILVHSVFPISLTGNKYFRDLVADVESFLDANPSEAVVMSIKREGTGKATDEQMSRILRDHYANSPRWYTEPRIPSLGEARGKIVLIRRHAIDEGLRGEWGGRGWAIDAQHWPDNCADGTTGSGVIRVQDFYEIDENTNVEKKTEFARGHLERAAQQLFHIAPHGSDIVGIAGAQPEGGPGPAPLPFFINFLSASNFFNPNCWPENIAAKINPGVIEYLCMRHGEHGKGPSGLEIGDAGTGIVVTDWVGHKGDWDLVRCIVGMNARLQLKK